QPCHYPRVIWKSRLSGYVKDIFAHTVVIHPHCLREHHIVARVLLKQDHHPECLLAMSRFVINQIREGFQGAIQGSRLIKGCDNLPDFSLLASYYPAASDK